MSVMKLCAAACVMNKGRRAASAADCGVTTNTARAWISALEASYIVYLLPQHHVNYGKRLVKAPKLYFYDTGLAAWLAGIRSANELALSSLRGPLFETWALAETIKVRTATKPKSVRIDFPGAGILSGDVVVLEFREPRNGEVVAALIDGETTLKRYVVQRGKPFLKAENPRFPNLIPAQELVIQGVQVALLRVRRAGRRSEAERQAGRGRRRPAWHHRFRELRSAQARHLHADAHGSRPQALPAAHRAAGRFREV